MTDTNDTTNSDNQSTDSETELKEIATGGDTATVDLRDLVADLEAEAEALREQKRKAETNDDVQWLPEEYAGIEYPVRRVEHSAELVRSDIDEFDGSQFVIQKARAGDTMRASDMVAEDSLKSGGDARSHISSAKKRLVQVCTQEVPPETPTTADEKLAVAAFEEPTFDWLHQKIDNFNTYGQVDLKDF